MINLLKKYWQRESLLWGLLLLLPVLYNPFWGHVEAVRYWALLLIPSLIGLAMFFRGEWKLKNDLLLKLLGGFFICALLASLGSSSVYTSFWGSEDRLLGLLTWGAAALLGLIISQTSSSKESGLALTKILQWSGTITAIVALVFAYFQTGVFEQRIGGTLGNPNPLGEFLLITLIVSVFSLSKAKKVSSFSVLALLIQGSAFLLTGNRASWLALGILLLVAAFHEFKTARWKFLGCLALLVCGVLFELERVMDLQSLITRMEVYKLSLDAIAAHPWFGYGFDQTDSALAFPASYTMVADRAHQFFLDLMLTVGIPGTLLFSGGLFLALKKLFRAGNPLAWALMGLLITMQFGFLSIVTLVWMFVFMGIALRAANPSRG